MGRHDGIVICHHVRQATWSGLWSLSTSACDCVRTRTCELAWPVATCSLRSAYSCRSLARATAGGRARVSAAARPPAGPGGTAGRTSQGSARRCPRGQRWNRSLAGHSSSLRALGSRARATVELARDAGPHTELARPIGLVGPPCLLACLRLHCFCWLIQFRERIASVGWRPGAREERRVGAEDLDGGVVNGTRR